MVETTLGGERCQSTHAHIEATHTHTQHTHTHMQTCTQMHTNVATQLPWHGRHILCQCVCVCVCVCPLQDRVPYQYLVSTAHWRTYTLSVAPGVLIPRPETEIFADYVSGALARHPQLAGLPWADLGTGSGAIAMCAGEELGKALKKSGASGTQVCLCVCACACVRACAWGTCLVIRICVSRSELSKTHVREHDTARQSCNLAVCVCLCMCVRVCVLTMLCRLPHVSLL